MNTPTAKRRVAKNLLRSVSGVSFPLAGSIVVIYTLSGQTRQVAIIATTIAIIGHIVHSMLELSEGHTLREQTEGLAPDSMMK